MTGRSLVVVGLLCCLSTAHTVSISNFITPCSFKDPQLDDCATIQGKALHPHLVSGIREWSVPMMSPLVLPEVLFIREGGQYLSLHINFTNTSHHGWKEIKFGRIKFHTNNLTLDADWTIDNYKGVGNYEVFGNVLRIPIYGNGVGTIKTRNLYQTVHIKFEKEERKGKTYLKPTDLTTSLLVKYSHYDVKNLFGNQVLSNLMNIFLNNNAPAVYREVRPFIEEIIGAIMLSIIKDLFGNVPMNEMFKDVD